MFPEANVTSSFTRTQKRLAFGLAVALQKKVTFFLSVSMTVKFCGPWTTIGETANHKNISTRYECRKKIIKRLREDTNQF